MSHITPNPTGGAIAAAGGLLATNNLADVASPATARGNLGLGTAAVQPISAFDPAGAASQAIGTAFALGGLL